MKKDVLLLASLIKEKGYWSKEVREILEKYDRLTSRRLEVSAMIYNETGKYKLVRQG